ncbi:hypothetical protein PM082_004257 [Marasmius tenuissimus]|nr:hypothetical protein PM082_004257 [Marasmius tenuissimus]
MFVISWQVRLYQQRRHCYLDVAALFIVQHGEDYQEEKEVREEPSRCFTGLGRSGICVRARMVMDGGQSLAYAIVALLPQLEERFRSFRRADRSRGIYLTGSATVSIPGVWGDGVEMPRTRDLDYGGFG